MTVKGYLYIKKAKRHSREKDKVEWRAKKPAKLESNEVIIEMELDVPDALFQPLQLFAKVEVPYIPSQITADVVQQIEKTVRDVSKVNIKIFQ